MKQNQSSKPPIGIQIIVITFVLIATALSLIGFLSYDNFKKRYIALRRSAYGTLAHEVKEAIENDLALGFSCKELQTASAVLANAKEDAEDIHTLSLFDKKGVLLQRVSNGNTIIDSISETLRAEVQDSGISYRDGNNSVSIAPLFNRFSVIEGFLVIEYSTLDSESIGILKKRSLMLILILLLIALVPLVLIIRHLVFPVLKGIEMMEAEFLAENEIEGARNETVHSAKQVMTQALSDFDRGKESNDE